MLIHCVLCEKCLNFRFLVVLDPSKAFLSAQNRYLYQNFEINVVMQGPTLQIMILYLKSPATKSIRQWFLGLLMKRQSKTFSLIILERQFTNRELRVFLLLKLFLAST